MNLEMLVCSLFLLTLLIRETEFVRHKFSDVVEPITNDHVEPLKSPVRTVLTKTSTVRSTTADVKHKSKDKGSPEESGNEIVPSTTLTPDEFKFCPPELKPCKKPKAFHKTKDLVCYSSKSCVDGFICCPDSCYEHKICKNKAKRSKSADRANANNTELPSFKVVEMKLEICPIEKSPCLKPADINETERYKCVDDACPAHFKCCEDSCFVHKICKQTNETLTKMSVLVSSDDNDTDSESKTASVLTTAGADNNNCTVDSKVFKKTKVFKESLKFEESKEIEKPITKNKPAGSTKKFLSIADKLDSDNPKECPAESLVCSSPLNENDTKQFDCDKKKCPESFFCCKDNCFAHKICKEPSSSNGSYIRSSRIREVCPAIEESCLLPADIKNAIFCTTQDNCTSAGLKCCADACFKRNVCKKSDILIEARVETCPEEPKICNSVLRDIKIHPRYVCNAKMSNCPEGYKCCSDKCHNADLCKSPDVHIVIKKLIPTTTNPNATQNVTSPVAGNQNATIPQPGNQNVTSLQAGTQNTTVSQIPVSQAGNQNATSSQSETQNSTVLQTPDSQLGNQNAPSQPETQNTIVQETPTSQLGNQNATSLQSGAENTTGLQTPYSQPGNQNATSSQLGTQNATGLQTPVSQPGNQNAAPSQPETENTIVQETPTSQPGNQNATLSQSETKNTTTLQNPTLQSGNQIKSGDSSSVQLENLPTVHPANPNRDAIQSTSTFPESEVHNQPQNLLSKPNHNIKHLSKFPKNPSAHRTGNLNPVNLRTQNTHH